MVGVDGACGWVLLDAVQPGLGEAVKVLTKMHQQSDKYFPSPDLRLCTCSNDIFLASYNPEFIFHVALPQVLSFLFY